ncbi:MAG: type II toxin-antitoxin system VapC family toxin [Chloroflexi bacterium]|nr:type II toxin-antitoxin system VapC family toxin [Chloroflexota bacterium]
MSEVVLDASALLALLNAETGADKVAECITEAMISAVNLSEVVGKLAAAGMPEAAIRQALQGLDLKVTPFDEEQSYGTGMLRATTEDMGLSLGDRACLNLARSLGLPALTADKLWGKLSMGVAVRVIR